MYGSMNVHEHLSYCIELILADTGLPWYIYFSIKKFENHIE